jgi:hypothetical protein
MASSTYFFYDGAEYRQQQKTKVSAPKIKFVRDTEPNLDLLAEKIVEIGFLSLIYVNPTVLVYATEDDKNFLSSIIDHLSNITKLDYQFNENDSAHLEEKINHYKNNIDICLSTILDMDIQTPDQTEEDSSIDSQDVDKEEIQCSSSEKILEDAVYNNFINYTSPHKNKEPYIFDERLAAEAEETNSATQEEIQEAGQVGQGDFFSYSRSGTNSEYTLLGGNIDYHTSVGDHSL